jgi:hypothetical protein
MTYDPIDTNENDNNADGSLTIDDLTATTVAGLDTSSGTGNEQIFTDGKGGLTARGYENVSVSQLPVAYSNLVAWYPFDSDTYGGLNAHDVTATLGGSGDDTAYDGTVNGVTYQSSGGVTDINAGVNSGEFDFDGTNDFIEIPPTTGFDLNNVTMSFWTNFEPAPRGTNYRFIFRGSLGQSSSNSSFEFTYRETDGMKMLIGDGSTNVNTTTLNVSTNSDEHVAGTYDGSTIKVYINGNLETSISTSITPEQDGDRLLIGTGENDRYLDGTMDDVRIYNTALSATQINQIYLNTEP